MAQFLDLALQSLHLRLQGIDLVDQFDIGLGAVLALTLLFELGDTFGQAQTLRLRGQTEGNGGRQGRRHAQTRQQARATHVLLLRRVDDFDAAILLPATFAVVLAHRTLFAIADDIELAR